MLLEIAKAKVRTSSTASFVLGDCHAQEQGQTVKKAVVDLGKSEATAGLTLVFPSRDYFKA